MIRSMVTRFGHDRSGVAFIIFALMAGVLIPVAGGALDYSRALTVRERLAAAADAAALAISRQQAEPEQAKKTALAILNANYPAATRERDSLEKSDEPEESTPSSAANANAVKTADKRVTGDVELLPANNRVTVQFSANVEALFLPIIGIDSLPATARAVAERAGAGVAPCVYMRSLFVRGSLAIDDGCPFHVADGKSITGKDALGHSTFGAALEVEGSFANSGKVTVEGSYKSSNDPYPNKPKEDQPQATPRDPLEGKTPPSESECPDTESIDNEESKQVNISDDASLKPLKEGTYCRSWELHNGAVVLLNPGTYNLHEAINVHGAAEIRGDGVTLVFHDNGRFNIDTKGNGTGLDVFASPPTVGIYANVLIYQMKSAANVKCDAAAEYPENTENPENTEVCNKGINRINGSLDFASLPKVKTDVPAVSRKFSGIVFTPDMDYDLHGAFAFKTATKAVFVARDVYRLKVGAPIHFSVPAASAQIIDGSAGARSVLVE